MKSNWQTKKLGRVCTVIAGQSPEGKFYNRHGKGLPFYQGKKEFGDKFIGEPSVWTTKVTKEAYAEDILMSVRAPVGPTNFATEKICIGRGLAAIRPSDAINKDFLYNFLKMYESQIVGNTGAVFNSISKTQIESIEIPLPTLTEQKRIVKKLDEIFEKVTKAKEAAEKNLQNSKDLFESYLNGVFTNSGKDWERKKLGDIGKVSMCKRVFKQQTTKTGDIPFYKIGTFGKKPDAFISSEIYNEFRKKYPFPKKGDVLLSASGTIGRRVRYDGEPAYFQDSNIVWIDNDEKQVLNDYLYQFYGACNWNPAKGATISRLYNDNLRKIEISFPKSLAEQRAVVKKLEELSAETKKLEKIYEQKLVDLEELKKSVLSKAFYAEL